MKRATICRHTISGQQALMLEEFARAARDNHWHTTELPGEYGTVRLTASHGRYQIRATAIPLTVQRDQSNHRRRNLISFHRFINNGWQPIRPSDVHKLLTT